MRDTTETYYLFRDAVDKDEIVSNFGTFSDDLVIGIYRGNRKAIRCDIVAVGAYKVTGIDCKFEVLFRKLLKLLHLEEDFTKSFRNELLWTGTLGELKAMSAEDYRNHIRIKLLGMSIHYLQEMDDIKRMLDTET